MQASANAHAPTAQWRQDRLCPPRRRGRSALRAADGPKCRRQISDASDRGRASREAPAGKRASQEACPQHDSQNRDSHKMDYGTFIWTAFEAIGLQRLPGTAPCRPPGPLSQVLCRRHRPRRAKGPRQGPSPKAPRQGPRPRPPERRSSTIRRHRSSPGRPAIRAVRRSGQQVDFQAVIGRLDMVGQLGLQDAVVEVDMHVGQDGALRLQARDHLERLVD